MSGTANKKNEKQNTNKRTQQNGPDGNGMDAEKDQKVTHTRTNHTRYNFYRFEAEVALTSIIAPLPACKKKKTPVTHTYSEDIKKSTAQ